MWRAWLAAGMATDPLHALAGDLNAKGLGIRGAVSEIVLVGVTPGEVRPLAHFPFGSDAEFGA